MVTTSASPFLPACANTLRTSAVLPALHAILKASSQQASRRNASTWTRHGILWRWQCPARASDRLEHILSTRLQ